MKVLISIKRAFSISSNVAAVRLAEKIGRGNIIKQAKKLGIISNISDNPSMALGVSSFSLLETVDLLVQYVEKVFLLFHMESKKLKKEII